MIDFLYSASEETRRHVDACIKDALSCAVKIENEAMVIGILTNFCNNKKIKTLTDTAELIEDAVNAATMEQTWALSVSAVASPDSWPHHSTALSPTLSPCAAPRTAA